MKRAKDVGVKMIGSLTETQYARDQKRNKLRAWAEQKIRFTGDNDPTLKWRRRISHDLLMAIVKIDEEAEKRFDDESNRSYRLFVDENHVRFDVISPLSAPLNKCWRTLIIDEDICVVAKKALAHLGVKTDSRLSNVILPGEYVPSHRRTPTSPPWHQRWQKDKNVKSKVTFERPEPKFKKMRIEDIPTGSFFVNGYHSPTAIMNGNDKASIYVKLPRSDRSVGSLLAEHHGSISLAKNAEAITAGRIAFNLTFGATKAFDPSDMGFIVDAEIAAKFIHGE